MKNELEIILEKINKLDKSFLYYSQNDKKNLKPEYNKKAEEIITKNIIKKNCGKCYGRGYLGWTVNKELIVCKKCVNVLKTYKEWYEYLLSIIEEDIKK